MKKESGLREEVEIATNVKLNPLYIIELEDEIASLKKFELEIELEDSNTDREEEVLVKEIGTLKCVLSHLFNLKSGGDETRVTGIAQADNNYQQAIRLGNNQSRSRMDIESEISTQIQT